MDKFLLPIPVTNPSYSEHVPGNFRLPPLDGSLFLPDIYDWHLQNNPRHSIFIYENDHVGFTHLSYSDIVPAAHKAGRIVGQLIGIDVNSVTGQLMTPIAIMASTDMITSFCTMLGMMRAGIPILAFAPRNSPQAVAHLLRETQSGHLLISPEPSVIELAKAACEILTSDKAPGILPRICSMPEYRDIFNNAPYVPLRPRKYDNEIPAILVHSSGSTSLPKPIPWTHKLMLQCGVAPLYGSHNYCGKIFALHSMSMSYGAGIHLIGWVATSGMTVATFEPRSPAQIPTPLNTLKAFANLSADYIVTFPHYIEEWSRSEESLVILKRAKRVIYVGGFLNSSLGNSLAGKGVELYPLFGMGEGGVMGAFLPPNQGMEWEYFPLTPHSGATFIEADEGMYELYIVKSPTKDIRKTNCTLDESPAYRGGDLFIQHPQKPGYWKVIGRKDDRIIHSNGEKTDPAPLEHVLKSDHRIRSAIIFGSGRARNGVLVELYPEYYFDSHDEDKLKEFRVSFRWTLQRMNKIAPGQSRIFPEMVITTSADKPFTYTLKGSLKRSAVLAAYAEEIENLYQSTDSSAPVKTKIPKTASQSDILNLTRSILQDSLLQVADIDDIFYHGCDSLKAMRIENQIRSILLGSEELEVKVEHLPRWFIYDYPTVLQLAAYIFSFISKESTPDTGEQTSTLDILNNLLEDLEDLPVLTEVDETRKKKKTVIVTGTTGDLGASVLLELIRNEDVNKIFAFTRRSSDASALDRHIEAFTLRGLDTSTLASDKVKVIEADLLVDGFKIKDEILLELRSEVTHVIHLAWPVNWNMSVASFHDILQSTRNLVRFALTIRSGRAPTFMFSSSIGIFGGINPHQGPVKELPLSDVQHAQGMGYAESKAIVEVFLNKVQQKTNLKTIIFRIGQITSRTWSPSHWFPMIVKTSVRLGCFPDIKGNASWLDVSIVARSVVDLTDTSGDVNVVHILHPRPKSINQIIQHIATHFKLPVVPYQNWLEKLLQSDSSEMNALPALKIMRFLQRDASNANSEAPGFPRLDMHNSLMVSDSLRAVETLQLEEVNVWVAYWKKSGFLPS